MALGDKDHLLNSVLEASPEQSAFYKQNGFLVLTSPSHELAQNIVEWTEEVKSLPHKTNAWLHYEEVDSKGHRTLTTTENFADYHTGFSELFRGAPLLKLLRTLLGEEMVLFKEKINYKAAQSGGFKAHTDAPAYVTIPNIGLVLAIMIAVDPQTAENGCLEVVAGSHKVDIPVGNDHCLDDSWCDNQTWTPLHLQRGQFVVFDSHLAHRSGANNTSSGRAAIFATYNALAGAGDKRAAYYADRRKLWPATADRKPDEDYAVGASIFGFATPMLTVDSETYKNMGL
ncbi:epoxidase subunit A [Mycena capillaripes]|nr:epoxidase subunit A [Mycena capillaripes]